MPLNIGYIEVGGGGVVVRVYYDTTLTPIGDDQPLINGPRGWCLDVTNLSGKTVKVTVSGVTGNPITANVQQGDPVTTGAARSRTAAQLATLGFTTRSNVGSLSVE